MKMWKIGRTVGNRNATTFGKSDETLTASTVERK
jgi:hypothetical protein